jgi:hypothetical protein
MIKYYVKLKKVDIETFEILESVYGVQCLFGSSVFEWHGTLNEERDSLQDDEQKGLSCNFQNRGTDFKNV